MSKPVSMGAEELLFLPRPGQRRVNCPSLCLWLSSHPHTAKSSWHDSASWCTSIIGTETQRGGSLGQGPRGTWLSVCEAQAGACIRSAALSGCYFPMSSICFLGQMLTFIMLARLATLCPAPVLQRVDRLIEPLRATCTAKVSPVLPCLDPECLLALVTTHCTVCTAVVVWLLPRSTQLPRM